MNTDEHRFQEPDSGLASGWFGSLFGGRILGKEKRGSE